MKKLEVRFTRSSDENWLVGILAEDRGQAYFEYAPDFLKRQLNLSPFRLPFREGLFSYHHREFGPLPGLFDDSLPDGWGLLLMDRFFRQRRLNLLDITSLDRLAWLGTRTMGALTYYPPADWDTSPASPLSLHDLARQSEQALAGKATKLLPQLVRAGGSPGGARPKVLAGVRGDELLSGEDNLPTGFDYWIIKFAAKEDGPDAGAVEFAYALMARAAGINVPPVRLFETKQGDRFFGTQRFDRAPNRRFHIHTFGNLLESNFRIPANDYADLFKATILLTRYHPDLLEAFRRMVFNVAAHNRDDHVKNFAYILDDTTGQWRLSPAYDLTLTRGPGGWHTMTVAGEDQNPRREHMLHLAEQTGIAPADARNIIAQVQAAITKWKKFAAQADVSPRSQRLVEQAIIKL